MVRKSGLQIFSTDFRCGNNNAFNLLSMTGKRTEFYLKSCINEEAKNTIHIADPHCPKYFVNSFFQCTCIEYLLFGGYGGTRVEWGKDRKMIKIKMLSVIREFTFPYLTPFGKPMVSAFL